MSFGDHDYEPVDGQWMMYTLRKNGDLMTIKDWKFLTALNVGSDPKNLSNLWMKCWNNNIRSLQSLGFIDIIDAGTKVITTTKGKKWF